MGWEGGDPSQRGDTCKSVNGRKELSSFKELKENPYSVTQKGKGKYSIS